MMPELDGPSVYQRVQREQPHLAERFVFATGGAFTEHTRSFLASMARPVLDKPLDVQLVVSVVAKILAPPHNN